MRLIFFLFMIFNSIAVSAQYVVGTGVGYYPLYRNLVPNTYVIGSKIEVKRYARLDSLNYLGGEMEYTYSLNRNTLHLYNLSLEYIMVAQDAYFLTGINAGKMYVNLSDIGLEKSSNSFIVYTGVWKKFKLNDFHLGINARAHMYEHTTNLGYDIGLRYSL